MNKLNLSVPSPCHEDWAGMHPQEKGRFCGSCQKTVVDFTGMSDRELVSYFKKPAGSVCGRFHADQLNREVRAPNKRIPWIKYFFTIGWPASVFLLKSCGIKERLSGEVVQAVSNKPANNNEYAYLTVGVVMAPGILPIDTVPPAKPEEIILSDDIVIGKMEPISESSIENSIIVGDVAVEENPSLEVDTTVLEPDYRPLDTVVVTAHQQISCTRVLMGAVSVHTTSSIPPALNPLPPAAESSFAVYPNPARAGALLTIQLLKQSDQPEMIHLLSASGQQLAVKRLNKNAVSRVTQLTIPGNVPTGMYFVHLVYNSGKMEKSSILITR